MLYSAKLPGGFRCAGLFSRSKRNRNTKRAGVQTSPCGCNGVASVNAHTETTFSRAEFPRQRAGSRSSKTVTSWSTCDIRTKRGAKVKGSGLQTRDISI